MSGNKNGQAAETNQSPIKCFLAAIDRGFVSVKTILCLTQKKKLTAACPRLYRGLPRVVRGFTAVYRGFIAGCPRRTPWGPKSDPQYAPCCTRSCVRPREPAVCGPVVGHLEAILGHFEAILRSFWAILNHFGPFWASLGHFDAILRPFWTILGCFGPVWAILRPFWAILRPF